MRVLFFPHLKTEADHEKGELGKRTIV